MKRFSMGGYQGFGLPAEVSASYLAYLFADRFVRPMSWSTRVLGHAALVTPTSGRLVQIGYVQVQCLATALWSLEHHGFIAIFDKAPSASNLLGRIGEHQLMIDRLGEGEDLVGLEGLVLSALPGAPVIARDLLNLTPLTSCLLTHFSFPSERRPSTPTLRSLQSEKVAFHRA